MKLRNRNSSFAIVVAAVAMVFAALGSAGTLEAEEDPGLYYKQYYDFDVHSWVCQFTGCQAAGTCCNEPG